MFRINKIDAGKRKAIFQKYLFIITICIIPITQFMIFYFGVNINSILLAFKTYDNGNLYFGGGFKNFADFFADVGKSEIMITAIKNSSIQYILSILISTPISLFTSYLIWKGIPLSGAFKVILMLPAMISGTVFAIIARYFLEVGIPNLFDPEMNSLIYSADTTFITILLYDMWLGFAGNLVLYLGAMSGISVDVVEYGKIDGMNSLQEFIHIVIPGIWPTISMFLVAGVAGFFTN
ncbi:MAG: sugar ABC transporter permease, partial [Clostridia bacterium]|nr:sugar ABC transporter permease [Clostridia bacterium]